MQFIFDYLMWLDFSNVPSGARVDCFSERDSDKEGVLCRQGDMDAGLIQLPSMIASVVGGCSQKHRHCFQDGI